MLATLRWKRWPAVKRPPDAGDAACRVSTWGFLKLTRPFGFARDKPFGFAQGRRPARHDSVGIVSKREFLRFLEGNAAALTDKTTHWI